MKKRTRKGWAQAFRLGTIMVSLILLLAVAGYFIAFTAFAVGYTDCEISRPKATPIQVIIEDSSVRYRDSPA